jgi:hypothetical protein
VRIGDDGSVAAILPAGKAMTWEMLADDAAKTSQVKERFWVTFQKGEVRTCTNCHGINTFDQTGAPAPTNPPAALAALLAQWRSAHPPGVVQHASAASSAFRNAGTALLSVTRTGGSTGPASVDYASADGTALAGTDYTAVAGTLDWADGDTTAKTIAVPLLNAPIAGAGRTLTVALSAPLYADLGSTTMNTLTLLEPTTASGTLDVDGNGQYDALTDGLLLMRYLFGISGTSLVSGAIGPNPARASANAVAAYLDAMHPLFDVDNNGNVDALTDGLMVLRYLIGLRGAAMAAGAIGPGATRDAAQIETYIQSLMP